jgi:outer membrane receptor protein involved in Fe transport
MDSFWQTAEGCPTMKLTYAVAHLCALFLLSLPFAQAETMQGIVTDPARAPIAGARVAAVSPVGVIAETTTNAAGRFEVNVPDVTAVKLVITANGFATATITAGASAAIKLAIAPVSDSVAVTGSAVDVPSSELGTSVSIITGQEIRERNEGQAIDLLRYLPGVYVAQSGGRGTVGSVSIRGGDTKYNLVQINGVPVNSFYYGGYFDFSQVPTDYLERIEVARGPQSAIYGSYANSGVISLITRSPADGVRLDLLAEGGSWGERRFAASGSGTFKGIGIAASLSRLDSNGSVPNSDYMNENVFLNVSKKWNTQSISAFGNYDANETGEPGPYGSDPLHLYGGIDTISRSRNYFSDYGLHYQADLTPKVREELFGSFFLNNSPYESPYGYSYSKDIRGQAEERTSWNVARYWTLAAGFVYTREEVKNTYIADYSSRNYPLRRDEEALYWDNQFLIGKHFFLNAGFRAEFFQQPLIPPTQYSAALPAQNYSQVNPKLSAAYLYGTARFHGSFGTGIRPPGGSDLAFTNNPGLKPEKSLSFDIGVEQRLLNNKLLFDATYFYNKYTDVIVSLGGNLSVISSYQTANVARAESKGFELSGQFHPARWISIGGNYTHLDTSVLSLEGSSDLVQKYYTVGQQLPRRPPNAGSLVSTFVYKRITANVLGYFRGKTLDVEPNYGVSAGFFPNSGFENIGVNVNFALSHGVTLYGNLRNALNQRYEEIYGYPAPLLNFVAGVKWSLPGGSK